MELIIKKPHENVIDTLNGKRVLFLENDSVLQNGLDRFEDILKSANIDYTVLFELSEMNVDSIIEAINSHDAIVFQTQWVYDISKTLFKYIKGLEEKKIVVEVYIHNPTWYYQHNHGSIHDVYIFKHDAIFSEDFFYKITDEAYWDYKNQFNK